MFAKGRLQELLSNGHSGPPPGPADGQFGPKTRASVEAFQTWGHVRVDGVIAEHTWDVSVLQSHETLESYVGLVYVNSEPRKE